MKQNMRMDDWKNRIREIVEKAGMLKILIVIASGVLLILLSFGGQKEPSIPVDGSGQYETESGKYDLQQYQKSMEKQVEDILQQVDGVGQVDVMITLKSSGEKVTLKDYKTNENSREEESVLTENEKKETEPFVIREVEPEIEGILVVCTGGDRPVLQREIIAGISALFSVESHKIKVMKSKEAKE